MEAGLEWICVDLMQGRVKVLVRLAGSQSKDLSHYNLLHSGALSFD